MTTWMALPSHIVAPYPTAEERRELALVGGISEQQVVYWFSNARKRSWKARKRVVARRRYTDHRARPPPPQPQIVAAGIPPPSPGRRKRARVAGDSCAADAK
jgi:hypothetical protein